MTRASASRVTNVRPFDGPEFDTPPDAGTTRALTYVVCATPRTGSGLLCRALAGTGVAGTPTEYFDAERRALLTRRWGCGPGLAAYAEALQARRTSPDGVFGIKLHWHQVGALRAESLGYRRGEAPFDQPSSFLERLFGASLTYVRVLRSDVNRQAISLWVAERSGVWGRGPLPPGERSARVRYSFEGIRRARARIVLGETQWDRYCRFNGITPIEVVYEDSQRELRDDGGRAPPAARARPWCRDSRTRDRAAGRLPDRGAARSLPGRPRASPPDGPARSRRAGDPAAHPLDRPPSRARPLRSITVEGQDVIRYSSRSKSGARRTVFSVSSMRASPTR